MNHWEREAPRVMSSVNKFSWLWFWKQKKKDLERAGRAPTRDWVCRCPESLQTHFSEESIKRCEFLMKSFRIIHPNDGAKWTRDVVWAKVKRFRFASLFSALLLPSLLRAWVLEWDFWHKRIMIRLILNEKTLQTLDWAVDVEILRIFLWFWEIRAVSRVFNGFFK